MGKKNEQTQKKTQADVKGKIVFAALDLAADQGWAHVNLSDIAQSCDMDLEALNEFVDYKEDVLDLFGRMVDKRMLAGVRPSEDGEACVRDRIFDVLMDRYDILNEYRPGFVNIIRSFKCDPKQAVVFAPHIYRSMDQVLGSIGVETSGVMGALRVAGLTGAYLRVLKVWMDDESQDLSKTMASLDKTLRRGESVFSRFGI